MSFIELIFSVIVSRQILTDLTCIFFVSVACPKGFPSEYSIIAAFEFVNGSLWLGWNLQQVSSSGSKDHAVIHVLTERQPLDLFCTTPDQTLILRTIKNARKDFDGP